jgi:tetratricopeptide (TPR) repeat protein
MATPSGARAALEQAIQSGVATTAAAAWLKLGELLQQQGDIDRAAAAFDRAHEYDEPEAQELIGARLGDRIEAVTIERLRQLIDTGDRDEATEAAFELAQLLANRRDHAGAKRWYEYVVASGHPDQAPGAAVNLGNLLAETGDTDGAQRAYEKAIAFGNPAVAPSAAVNLGGLLASAGENARAREVLKLALDCDDELQVYLASRILADIENNESSS